MTAVITEGSCPWCSREGLTIWHSGGCPRVKAIEYYPSGGVKRVEFHEERISISVIPTQETRPWRVQK